MLSLHLYAFVNLNCLLRLRLSPAICLPHRRDLLGEFAGNSKMKTLLLATYTGVSRNELATAVAWLL